MLIKQCQFKGMDDDGVYFHLLRPGYRNSGLSKTASAKAAVLAEVDHVMRTAPRDSNLLYALVSAMGAWEYWGQNSNGDAFPERALIHTPKGWEDLPLKSRPPVGRNWEWGYPTFYNAHAFQHHCFPAGTMVVLGDRSRAPIDEVVVGDRVATRFGARAVSRVMRRKYSGSGVSLKLRGLPERLVATADHPVLVLRREQVHCRCGYSRLSETADSHQKKCKEAQQPIGRPTWAPASEVRPGDYLLAPSPVRWDEPVGGVGEDFAELVGWVASEGHLGKRGLIQFSFAECNVEDITAVRACMERLSLHVTETPRPQYGLVMLSACSKEMHAKLSEYVVGVLSDKSLTGAVLSWSKNSLLRMLGAYIDGDGSVCSSGKNKGQLRIRSSSPQMRKMLLDVIHSLGEYCTEQLDIPPGEMVSPTNGKVYQHSGSGVVHVNATAAKALTKYSRKAGDKRVIRNRRTLPYDDCFLVQVRDVDQTDLDEDVYNLEVDGEHEYIANEVVVHNCNKDPARAFGEVTHAMWDPFMKRVLLVLALDRKRADAMGAISVIDKIENGEFPDISMGCKVPYDLCLHCTDWDRITGNPQVDLRNHRKDPIRGLSETTKDYCDHLANELGRIYSNGTRAGMANLHPRFFDVSVVFIGADKTSRVMAKLAGRCPIREKAAICGSCRDCDISSTHVYEVWSGGRVKVASDQSAMLKEAFAPGDDPGTTAAEEKRLNRYFSRWKSKRAEIEKQVKSNFAPMLPKIDRKEEDLPEDVLNEMSRDVPRSLCTAGSMGVVLKPREFQRTMLTSVGRKPLADAMDHRGICFGTGAPPERTMDIGGGFIPSLIQKLLPLLAGRSAFGPAFHKRVVIMVSGGPKDSDEPIGERGDNDHPLLHKLSAAYTDYRRQLLYKVAGDAGRMVGEYPRVLPELFPEALELTFAPGLAKTGGYMVQSLIGMMPTMYLNGAYLDEPVSGYVDAHPDFDGIVAAGALAARGRVA